MKIIQLEILNLASLDKQGGEVINFVEGALGESTIFSIVGPTGSGKSTILDAICLALYNRAPRYPRKKGEKSKIEIYGTPDKQEANRLAPTDCRNILSNGKKEGYSKLTFLANNGNCYRAEWHIRFKSKKFENPVTKLYKLTKSPDGIPQEEPAVWEDLPAIIGLDYEQFLRTVLIAQGSFANFLTAKEDERYELLEKLIGCEDLYIRIANEIKSKKDAAVENFNLVNASINAVKENLLTEEEHSLLKKEISELDKAEKELDAKIKKVETQLQWYDDDEKMVANIKQQQALVEKARQELQDFHPSIQRLNLHDAIAPAVEILKDVRKKEEKKKDLEKNIEDGEQNAKQQEEKILSTNDELNHLKEKTEKIQEDIDAATPHIQKARELRTKIDAAKNVCDDKQKAKKAAEKEKNQAEKAVKDNITDIGNAQKEVENAEEEEQNMVELMEKKKAELSEAKTKAEELLLAEKQKVEGMDAEELQNQKTLAENDWQNVKRALEVVGNLDDASEEQAKKETRKTELKEKNTNLSEELGKLDINTLKNEVEKFRNIYTLMTSEKWELHRDSLEEGKPCPLCGATNHPYKVDEARYDEATTELYTLLQQKEETLRTRQQNEKEWTGEMKKNEGEISELDNRLRQLKTSIEKLENDWQRLHEQYPQLRREKGELEAALPSYENKKKETNGKLSFFNNVQKEITKLTKKKEKAANELSDYLEEASNNLAKVQQKVIAAKTKLAETKALTQNLLQQQDEKRKAQDDADTAWKQADDTLKELTTAFKNELKGEDPDIVEQRLKKSKEKADTAVTMKNEEIAKMKAKLGEMKGALQTNRNNLEEERVHLTEKSTELTGWIARYNESEDRIQDISIEDVKDMCQATENWKAIRQEKERRNEKFATTSALLHNAMETHDRHQTDKPEKEREVLVTEGQELRNNSRNDELVTAKAKMKNHDDAMALLGDKVEELKQATKMKDDWTAITDAIGGEGKTLRKIAQCYTLSFLIEHANVEIRKFNRRYELQQVKNSLGIRVIDHDRADDVRETTSLSGGETFIVSLGLALGLSALSSRNISFENLFIDEGFGTLDPDMLLTVVDSLAMLQTSQGKKVGVISHTDTMSERITTQIRIIKNGSSGSSHIEIYP